MSRTQHDGQDTAQSPLETYLREINKSVPLTADQEKDLARKIGEGSYEARDEMVRANLRLVANIAGGCTDMGLPLEDLIDEGNLGLLQAVVGFDPTMNMRFSTYASYWIKQSIKRALVNTTKLISIPAYMVELLVKWRRGRNIDEMLMDPRSKTHDTEMGETDDLKHLMVLLEKMDKREATVLWMRFGLDDEEPKTLKEIGECLSLTRERVRQIESEALSKLGAEHSYRVTDDKTNVSNDGMTNDIPSSRQVPEPSAGPICVLALLKKG